MYGGETGGSQGAFGGGGFVASPGNAEGGGQSSQGGKKSAKNDAVLPFTVKLMAETLESAPLDDNIMYYGQEVHNVTLLGKLKDIQEVSTHSGYKIQDGTGIIEVKYYNNDKDEGGASGQELQIGSYVRVFGHLRAFSGRKMVVALSIRPVTDMNEITFHFLEVIYVRERLKGKGALTGVSPSGAPKAAPYNTPAASAGGYGAGQYGAPGARAPQGGKLASPLAAELNSIFEGEEGMKHGEVGISLDEIMALIGKRYAIHEVRATIETMMGEGNVFTTVDDSHFKSTSMS